MDKTIHFRDITGFYTDEGKGNAILLIHGFCEDGSIWDDFRKSLSRDFRIIVPDLPGYRNSIGTQQEFSIEWMADFVKAIIDKERIVQPAVIGHSMGGYITLALAEKYPDLPDKIGLFHSHCFADDDEKKKSRQKGIDFVSKNGPEDYVDELYGNLFGEKFLKENKGTADKLKAIARMYHPETIIEGLQAMMTRPDTSPVLKSFRKPVLFILGKQDKAIPYLKSLEQCSYPKIAEVHLLNESGHMGMIEDRQKTLEVVKEFLSR